VDSPSLESPAPRFLAEPRLPWLLLTDPSDALRLSEVALVADDVRLRAAPGLPRRLEVVARIGSAMLLTPCWAVSRPPIAALSKAGSAALDAPGPLFGTKEGYDKNYFFNSHTQ
jgi:hypothetical protein